MTGTGQLARVLSLADLDDATLDRVLARAATLERSPLSAVLAGKVLGLLFLDPSLRTVASFQAGMAQLGGASFVLTPGQGSWQLESRDGVVMDGAAAEHVREAVPVLCGYADALGVRAFAAGRDPGEDLAEPVLDAFARHATKPLLNLESAFDHPCQALADWKTLDDLAIARRGGRLVLSWAWHPKPLPQAVPAAVLQMAARRGMDVVVLRPPGFDLHPTVVARAEALAAASGGTVTVTADRAAALAGAHAVYAKSWRGMDAYGDELEDARLRAPLRTDWCVDEPWFVGTAAGGPVASGGGAVFMHCLPVRRNVVVSDRVLDGPRSVVLRQAANRLHVQKSLLIELLAPSSVP